jgi:hypothetical protein
MVKSKTQKTQTTPTKKNNKKISRPGVHSKTKQNGNKNSKKYRKPNVGQGK